MRVESIYIVILATGLSLAATFPETLLPTLNERDEKCYNSRPRDLCGVHGILKNESTGHIRNSITKSIVECHAMCLHDSCASLFFDEKTQRCTYWEHTLEQQNFVARPKTSGTFYNAGCFDCLYTCPPTQNKNLLLNGGFEQFPDSIVPWQPNIYAVAKPGSNSSQALQYGHKQESHYYRSLDMSQTVFYCTNTSYTVSFDYKIIFGNSKVSDPGVTMGFGEGVPHSQFRVGGKDTPNNTWISITKTVFNPTNQYSRVFFQFWPGHHSSPVDRTVIQLDNTKIIPA